MAKKLPKKTVKKSKSPNLVTPILTASMVFTIAITLFIARSWPVPTAINEVSGTTSNCSQVAFADGFSGTTLNTQKWNTYSNAGGTATTNNQLNLSLPSGITQTYGDSGITSAGKVEIEGDFIQEVTLNSLGNTPSTSNASSFLLGIASPDWKNWYRIEIYLSGDIQTHSTTEDILTLGTPANVFKNTPTKLKMVRSGSTITTYYDIGSGYVLHHTLNNIYTGKVFIHQAALSHAPEKPQVTATISNYALMCPTAKPTVSLSCKDSNPVANIAWVGGAPDPTFGYVVNLYESPSNNNYYNKTVGNIHATDSSGFIGTNDSPLIKGKSLTLEIGKKYAVNIWNGLHSAESEIFTISSCVQKPRAPLNLKVSCTPDGMSARFTWDGIEEAESYKVRLDDKNGNVTYFDNIKALQYIATVTPEKTYSFWAHSTKSGLDSDQSTAIDFTCKVTETPTPTPKPSVKPAIKPVTKGDVVPTDTPKPSIKASIKPTPSIRPSATPLQTDSPVTPTTTKTTSTNPIARFFAWLASLFE